VERPSSKQVSYPVVISLPLLTRRTIRAWRTPDADHRDIHERHGALGEDHARGEDVREEYGSAVSCHGLDLANGRSTSIVEGESLVYIAMEDGMSAAFRCLRILLRLFHNPPKPTWPEYRRSRFRIGHPRGGDVHSEEHQSPTDVEVSDMPVEFNPVSSTYRITVESFVVGLVLRNAWRPN